MLENYHVCLLTSCIFPNTTTGPITNFTKEERLNHLKKNINYLLETNIFKYIYIIDPFLINQENIKKFKYDLLQNGLKKSSKIKYITFNPNKKIKLEIDKKGKGYSELRMMIESNKEIKKHHQNIIIHKISGRYKILNIKDIVKKSDKVLKGNKLLYLPFSRLLSKCYTVLISYKSDIDENLFNLCLNKIDDRAKLYIEHCFYKKFARSKLTCRNNNVPKFELSMLGGSRQGRYGRLKQFFIKYLYGYI